MSQKNINMIRDTTGIYREMKSIENGILKILITNENPPVIDLQEMTRESRIDRDTIKTAFLQMLWSHELSGDLIEEKPWRKNGLFYLGIGTIVVGFLLQIIHLFGSFNMLAAISGGILLVIGIISIITSRPELYYYYPSNFSGQGESVHREVYQYLINNPTGVEFNDLRANMTYDRDKIVQSLEVLDRNNLVQNVIEGEGNDKVAVYYPRTEDTKPIDHIRDKLKDINQYFKENNGIISTTDVLSNFGLSNKYHTAVNEYLNKMVEDNELVKLSKSKYMNTKEATQKKYEFLKKMENYDKQAIYSEIISEIGWESELTDFIVDLLIDEGMIVKEDDYESETTLMLRG